MAAPEVYTVTVVRNIGTPVSFALKRRKILYLLIIFIMVLGFLLYGTLNYLFLRTQTQELREQLIRSQDKVKILSQQIAKLDHDRYWKNEETRDDERSAVRSAILKQPEFSTEGIWITDKSTLTEEDLQEGTSAEIDRFDAELKGDDLNLTLRLVNTSSPLEVVGGYLFVTLVNRDHSPPLFKSATQKGNLGENGYPLSYKLGEQYLLKGATSTKTISFRLTEVNEYYTEVIVFLYSYKGRLLSRRVMALQKEVFLE